MEEGGAALGADQFGNPVPKRKIVSRAAAEAAERVERQERQVQEQAAHSRLAELDRLQQLQLQQQAQQHEQQTQQQTQPQRPTKTSPGSADQQMHKNAVLYVKSLGMGNRDQVRKHYHLWSAVDPTLPSPLPCYGPLTSSNRNQLKELKKELKRRQLDTVHIS